MLKKLSLFLSVLFWAISSQAVPLTWNLANVTFDDGATATGSFVFDADAFTVLDWNISVSGGDENVFPVFTYTPLTAPETGIFDTGTTGFSIQIWIDSTAPGGTPDSRVMILTSSAPLTNSGGTVPLYVDINDPGWQSRECYNCDPYRLMVSGSINAVPLPAAIWLFGSGLIGLIGFARKR